jgi:hypothetical protein
MVNIMNLYYRTAYPDEPVELCKTVLSEDLDETKHDILVYTIALNAEVIDGKKIEDSLDESLKPKFREVYNMAYLTLKVWKSFVKSLIDNEFELPNLYIKPDDLKCGELYLYKAVLLNNRWRFEHKWRETVWSLSKLKMQSAI